MSRGVLALDVSTPYLHAPLMLPMEHEERMRRSPGLGEPQQSLVVVGWSHCVYDHHVVPLYTMLPTYISDISYR